MALDTRVKSLYSSNFNAFVSCWNMFNLAMPCAVKNNISFIYKNSMH